METPFATSNDENLPGEPIFGEKIGKFPESWQVRWLATTGSTNDDLLEAGRAGAPDRVALVTDYQSAGRGRLDRTWVAPDGANLLVSLLLRNVPRFPHALTHAVALAAAAASETVVASNGGKVEVDLKWPNDLYSPQGKWGGILVEPLSAHQAIVGVGINLNTPPVENADQAITSLNMLGLNHLDRLALIAELYTAIQQAAQWFEHGSYNLAERFNHHAIWLNQHVEFEHAQGKIQGYFQGISNDGAVLIKTEQTEKYYQGRLRLASL